MAESKAVVYAALAGNAAIAVVKGGAAAVTGSAAMASEAVHSAVDTLDQLLLLLGDARSRRPPDGGHPFGHGLEVYFWTFSVSVLVFLLGGAASVAEGVLKLREGGGGGEGAAVNYAVLAASALFEGASFLVGYRQYRRFTRGRVGLAAFVRRSKDPNLFVTLLEDGAALIGLAIAAAGVTGRLLGAAWADGAASCAIGALLMSVAVLLANETRSLIAGEAADPLVLQAVERALKDGAPGCRAPETATLQLGPSNILVCVTLDIPAEHAACTQEIARDLTRRVRAVDDRVGRVYFRPAPPERDATASTG